jgi:hypothetical protein
VIITAFSNLLISDHKADVKVIAVKFLCRALVCASPVRRTQLLGMLDIAALVDFLEADRRDVQGLVMGVCAVLLEDADRCPFDAIGLMGSPPVATALATIAEGGTDDIAKLAHYLLDSLDGGGGST